MITRKLGVETLIFLFLLKAQLLLTEEFLRRTGGKSRLVVFPVYASLTADRPVQTGWVSLFQEIVFCRLREDGLGARASRTGKVSNPTSFVQINSWFTPVLVTRSGYK